ncbi:MAG: Flp family type IVb pilin [Xanthobacteraceae bacterium]|nr:Flp family type IVb pilin [Xanthobacteraceae bacterium]PWB57985.1 MAG: Flp family type IVb pilin [Bradyrhizobiaceae bacterium]
MPRLRLPRLFPVDRFLSDETGATAIEYALIAAGVGATIASAVWGLGSEVKTTFYDKLTQLMN